MAMAGGGGTATAPRLWPPRPRTPPSRVLVGAALLVLAIVGVAVADRYGATDDAYDHRLFGHEWLDYALGGDEAVWGRFDHNRFYGAAFEMALALIERALGLEESHDVFLMRHLLTHGVFLVGGGCAALLAQRLFGSAWLALFALAAFTLHPRLYAHSFVNSKDLPFAAVFMVCLALAHRAFKRDTAGAFALLGVGVGVLTNQRVMGALLFALVAGLKLLDAAMAGSWAARRRALGAMAAFAAGGLCTLYAVWPYMWSDPARLVEAFAVLSAHPSREATLFQGELAPWPDIPASYAPVWIAITTPTLTLALCALGAAAAVGRAASAPGAAAGNAPPRFGLLLVACPLITLVAIVMADANLYDDWRHLYFLWAPLSLLAVVGLKWLAGAGRRRALKAGVQGVAVAGLGVGVAQMAAIHPQQALHFNLLVDRDRPERLGTWFETDYLGAARQVGRAALRARHPQATIGHWRESAPVPDIVMVSWLRPGPHKSFPTVAPTLHAQRVYDNTFLVATATNVALAGDAAARAWRARHRAVAAQAAVAHGEFTLHWGQRSITWLKEGCGPTDAQGEFVLYTPPAALGATAGGGPAAEIACDFARCGTRLGRVCMVETPLPTALPATLEAGQRLANGPWLWRVEVGLTQGGLSRRAGTPAREWPGRGSLAARSRYDLWLHGRTLTYARESCRPEDSLARRFFLHVFPADQAVLAKARRGGGFDNLDFAMAPHDAALIARLGGRCVAEVRLPGYPIARLRTGQFTEWGLLWMAEIAHPP